MGITRPPVRQYLRLAEMRLAPIRLLGHILWENTFKGSLRVSPHMTDLLGIISTVDPQTICREIHKTGPHQIIEILVQNFLQNTTLFADDVNEEHLQQISAFYNRNRHAAKTTGRFHG